MIEDTFEVISPDDDQISDDEDEDDDAPVCVPVPCTNFVLFSVS